MCGSGMPLVAFLFDSGMGIEGPLRKHDAYKPSSGRGVEILHESVELEFDVWGQE